MRTLTPRVIDEAEGWTKTKPATPGLYLRTELWGTPVHALVEVDSVGDLFVGIRSVKGFDDRVYWFGPLPEPPDA